MSCQSLSLHVREYGRAQGREASLLLLHGLLGSCANWHSLAQRLADHFHVLVPDLRNHGRSPHHEVMTYECMAADLLALLDERQVRRVIPVGHSMGGKLAMWLALKSAQRVARLVVVDIAPVQYPNRFEGIFSALGRMVLEDVKGRGDADAKLAVSVSSAALRQFLLQNLVRRGEGWAWRMNLPVLAAGVGALLDFSPPGPGQAYPGEALFAYGMQSDYVVPEHRDAILRLFPRAHLQGIQGAGHWVYAEQPQAFSQALLRFLSDNGQVIA